MDRLWQEKGQRLLYYPELKNIILGHRLEHKFNNIDFDWARLMELHLL